MSDKVMKALRALIGSRSQSSAQDALMKLAAADQSPSHDRALALVGIVYLEDALKRAIQKHFAPSRPSFIDALLFEDEEAPLGSLASKARLATALGIITDEMRKDLGFIRVIRNVFGHSSENITFQTAAILDAIDSLMVLVKSDFGAIPVPPLHIARIKFTIAILGYCTIMDAYTGKWTEEALDGQEALALALLGKSLQQSRPGPGPQPDNSLPPVPPPPSSRG